jgi:hypothetical protein
LLDSVRGLPRVVAHELVHTQQHYPLIGSLTGGPKILRGSLLRHSIAEGSADFIASLLLGPSLLESVGAGARGHGLGGLPTRGAQPGLQRLALQRMEPEGAEGSAARPGLLDGISHHPGLLRSCPGQAAGDHRYPLDP